MGGLATLAEMPPLPRPNLGPEPAPSGELVFVLVVISVVGIALAVLAIATFARRRRSRTLTAIVPDTIPADASLEVLSDLVRTALSERLGPTWSARTTEEIAVSRDLEEQVRSERLQELVAFFRASDQAKFGGYAIESGPWRDWAERFLSEWRKAAGPARTGQDQPGH